MSNIADGTYRLYNADYGCYVDVFGTRASNGSRTFISNAPKTNDAQTFEVTTRNNGTRRIQHRISGKNLIVKDGVAENGAWIVVQDEADDFDGQELVFTSTGSTTTIDGTTYDNYRITMTGAPNYVFDIEDVEGGGANEGYLKLTNTGGLVHLPTQEWCFVPVELFASGNLYEIRSMLDPDKLTLDVTNGNTANCTNIQLNTLTYSNAQRFLFVEETTGKHSIMCQHSGKYVDVAGAAAADGTNVWQYTDNDSNAQRWKIVASGTTTIDGKTCQVVKIGSYVTNDGATYYMDASTAQSGVNANIQIHTSTNEDSQLFALVPTSKGDGTMPVPYNFGLKTSIYDQYGSDTNDDGTASQTFNIGWNCDSSWSVDGNERHYEYRYRTRTMDSSTTTWNDWGSWTTWKPAPAYYAGAAIFMPESFDGSYTWATAKNKQYNFQLRTAVGDSGYGYLIHGRYIDGMFNILKRPAITFTAATWTPEGLVLTYTSDYTYGATVLTVDNIDQGNKSIYHRTDITSEIYETYADNTQVTIPAERLNSFPTAGSTLTITYRTGYDQYREFQGQLTANVTVTEHAGTIQEPPTFTRDGKRLIAFLKELDEERLWVSYEGGMYECEKTDYANTPSGRVAFNVLYPMGMDFYVYSTVTNVEGTVWCTDITAVDEVDVYAHAFDYDGKTVYIETFQEGEEQYSVNAEAQYQADILDSREHESVSFGATVKKSLTISGVITHDDYTLSDIDDMVGKHVIYRSPDGGLYNAAVTRYTATAHGKYTELSIDLIAETR